MVLCWLDTVTEGRGRPMNNILLINNVLSEASLFYALNSRYSCQKNLGFETAVSLTNGWFAEDDTCAGLTAAQIICQGTSVQTDRTLRYGRAFLGMHSTYYLYSSSTIYVRTQAAMGS